MWDGNLESDNSGKDEAKRITMKQGTSGTASKNQPG